MPVLASSRQPEQDPNWYVGRAGRAVLDSEWRWLDEALQARPGLPWLVLSAVPRPGFITHPHGLWLSPDDAGWRGEVHCGAELPLASESVGTVVVQHVGRPSGAVDWLAESARVLVPGGRLWLFALNPLSPYRRHWFSADAAGHEPVSWRRALRRAGLHADAVARGLGPRWRAEADAASQQGAGARAAYGLYAEKRHIPLTMQRAPLLVPALGEAT